jgi:hypothetical protein
VHAFQERIKVLFSNGDDKFSDDSKSCRKGNDVRIKVQTHFTRIERHSISRVGQNYQNPPLYAKLCIRTLIRGLCLVATLSENVHTF